MFGFKREAAQMLAEIANEWIGIQNEAIATAKLDEVKKNIAETWFAWSGSTDKSGGGYFRIQGPTVFIEFAPQRLGGSTDEPYSYDLS